MCQILEDYLRYKIIRKNRNPRKPKIAGETQQRTEDSRPTATRIQFTPRPGNARKNTNRYGKPELGRRNVHPRHTTPSGRHVASR